MGVNFSREDIILILGIFDKNLVEVEKIKDADFSPIDIKNINKDIEIYSSIVNKIVDAYPELAPLKHSKT